MKNQTFDYGTVVQLNSGGPRMTAAGETKTDGVHCIWFGVDGKRQASFFDPRVLTAVKESGAHMCSKMDDDDLADFRFD